MKFNFLLNDRKTKHNCLILTLIVLFVILTFISSNTNSVKSESSSKSHLKTKNNIDFLHYMANRRDEAKIDTHYKEKRMRKHFNGGNEFKFKSTNNMKVDTKKKWKYDIKEGQMLQSWMTISSKEFDNIKRFPPITLPNGTLEYIEVNPLSFRVNHAFNCTDPAKPQDERLFWFRLSKTSIWYSSTKSDINVLGWLNITEIYGINKNNDISGEEEMFCLNFKDEIFKEWRICNESKEVITLWFCTIKKYLGLEHDDDSEICWGFPEYPDVVVKEKTIKKPIIMVPLPSPTCNQPWNYDQNGDDWVCDCKEGSEQSPIDLPKIKDTIPSPVKPMFQYQEVDYINEESTLDGLLEARQKLEIRNSDNLIHIWHNNLGKAITLDGTTYQAQQITFHTPSNHRIDGKQYPLEVSIIHFGVTKGDIGKQLVLNFLFEGVPGVYNKFLEDLDLFNLPDKVQKTRGIQKPIFIPKILYEENNLSNDIPIMKPFSFYTYEGSLPFPPCTERTIQLVNSKPLRVSNTSIQLIKESSKMPDLKTKSGDTIGGSDSSSETYRSIQDTNGRPVYYYDHTKYCGPDPGPHKPQKTGHYEKIVNKGTQYFFVSGPDPSGMPGAFVVSEKEAKGQNYENI